MGSESESESKEVEAEAETEMDGSSKSNECTGTCRGEDGGGAGGSVQPADGEDECVVNEFFADTLQGSEAVHSNTAELTSRP